MKITYYIMLICIFVAVSYITSRLVYLLEFAEVRTPVPPTDPPTESKTEKGEDKILDDSEAFEEQRRKIQEAISITEHNTEIRIAKALLLSKKLDFVQIHDITLLPLAEVITLSEDMP